MKKPVVKVAAHKKTGELISVGKNPLYGSIRVEAQHVSLENGFAQTQNRSAYINGALEDLESFNFQIGQELSGKIIRKESYSPFYEGQTPKKNPQTDEIVLKNGREVYMQQVFTQVETAQDEWVGETAMEVVETTSEALIEQSI